MRLRNARVTVNPEKMSLAQDEIKFLRHIISSKGIHIDPERGRVVYNFPTPGDLKAAKRFLWMCSYHVRLTRRFSGISAPLNALKKNFRFVWGRMYFDAKAYSQVLENDALASYH
jgi:hypothetical protein